MSVKLEANNQLVVEYLNSLWSNQPKSVKCPSIIQFLIDYHIISKDKTVSTEVTEQSVTKLTEQPISEPTELIEQPVIEPIEQPVIEQPVIEQPVTELSVIEQPVTEPIEQSESDNVAVVVDYGDEQKFKKQVKENLKKLREVGLRVYHNIGLEKEVNLIPNAVTDNDIAKVFNFKTGTNLTRKSLMSDISRCIVFPKYKSGDVTKPENFRYLINHHNSIKIIDRLWCVDLIRYCGTHLPDKSIFKANLVKAFNGAIINTAIANTMTTDNVVLLDIERAFDSINWNVLSELLTSNLTRKINSATATSLVSQYMTIIENRELYYNNCRVNVAKGIPTGLPSSNLVFTLTLEEILFRWFNETKYVNGVDFIINIYVDDIYFKFINIDNVTTVVNSLREHLSKYKLTINNKKSKACPKLNTNIPFKLKNTDYYLGIPFTRDIQLYGKLILSEFQSTKLKMSWKQIYMALTDESTDSVTRKIIIGFMNYKLRPFINFDSIIPSDQLIKKFIADHYFTNTKYVLHCAILVSILLFVFMYFYFN